MAAAESRAGWKRNTNRCFIHENASRAPNSSSFPSSSSSSKRQSDGRPGDAAHRSDHPSPDCMHQNCNPLEDPAPDSKWWLYPQPNFGHQKGFEHEQLNTLENEFDILSYEFINQTAIEGLGAQTETKKNADFFLDRSRKASAASMKEDQFARMSKPKIGLHSNPQDIGKDKDIEELWYTDEDLDPVNSLVSEQSKKLSSDLESHWMGAEKTEPWWRKADKDTLASMVAQKSVEHIENCDLPKPQIKHFRRGLSASLEWSDQDWMVAPSLDQMAELGFSNLTDCTWKSHTSASIDEKQSSLGAIEYSPNRSDTLFRNNSHSITGTDQEETCHIPEDASKAQLVEALCHSQTRAREAEKAAQQAYEEKEHIIKLFFKQASQLFAYKQWLQLLQLETLCLEPKNKDQPISSHAPTVLPWIPYIAQKPRKGQHNGSKKGSTTNGNGRSRYTTVAFALGLGLAGAGLLLGWTLGWLFPALQTASSSRSASSSLQNSDSDDSKFTTPSAIIARE
uniref:Uncharacterized protein n=1 Tax=Vitis vinifera TaxID=29760 RepID=F6H799_VITVI